LAAIGIYFEPYGVVSCVYAKSKNVVTATKQKLIERSLCMEFLGLRVSDRLAVVNDVLECDLFLFCGFNENPGADFPIFDVTSPWIIGDWIKTDDRFVERER